MTWNDDDDRPAERAGTSVRHNSLPFLPLLLIAIGVGVVIDQAIGHGVGVWEVFWLAVGIWCLARARDDGPYPLLVIGAFLVGNNIGELTGAIIGRGVADAGETLGTAAGFLWLYTSDRPRSRWAIWPGAIIGFIGLGELGAEVTNLIDGGGWMLPAGVIVAGVLLLGAHRLPGPVRLAGLVFVAAAALSLIGNAGDRGRDGERRLFKPPTTISPKTFDLGTRTLEISGNNGAVVVQLGDTPQLLSGVVSDIEDDVVHVRPRTGNASVVVRVPAGTPLEIEVDNASVVVESPTENADITTDNGSITMLVHGDPTIDAESDQGQITVDGAPKGDDYEHSGSRGEVELRSENGAIVLTHVGGAESEEGLR